jgi:hypothetical protein
MKIIAVFFILAVSLTAICFAQESFDLTSGESKIIDKFSISKIVTNNCPDKIFVPVKTEREWRAFIDSAPSCVEMGDVPVPPVCVNDGESCGVTTSCCSGYCRGGICELDACGPCHWVDIECSHYGGIWSSPTVSCDPAHEGVIAMRNTRSGCGPQHEESYTSEYWDYRCFTGRAKCDCGTAEPPSAIHGEADCVNAGGEVVATETAGLKQCKFQASSCPSGWSRYKNWMTTKAATHTALFTCSYGCCNGAPNTATNPGHSWSNNDDHYPLNGNVCSGSGISYDGCEGDGRVYCGAFQALGEITEIGCY